MAKVLFNTVPVEVDLGITDFRCTVPTQDNLRAMVLMNRQSFEAL